MTTMTPQEIARLRMTARRAGRLESLLLEIANRAEMGESSDRLMGEVIDLAYAVVVAMPSLPPRKTRTSPCVACMATDDLDGVLLDEAEAVPR